MAGKFDGKTIVVTGSGKEKGLGQGILQRFADEGANCVVSDLSIGAEEEGVAEELRERGVRVATIACDVSECETDSGLK
ncbi:SDR family NAD(P)-dependent oxidoreductase [Parasphingorhabdus halotolerans]|uniref:SDR family NAD(P)-dependent oxidoreductase n=1 Tax=Parasphingorhabdus halotolerans TaxID=2725558 RepID=A0A6H2DP85_9SPHN|nr:SDR family NAD(P)-dependent oxidoreductase [Parasphingorhabdus halotolerans]QJB69476.1 SDR family NAD(P)-dependent oxidoreductase [Parasphingorhabdus halotolerans]